MSVRRRRIKHRLERDRQLHEGAARFSEAFETARTVFEQLARDQTQEDYDRVCRIERYLAAK